MGLSEFVKDMVMARKLRFEEGRFELIGVKGVILPAYTVFTLLDSLEDDIGDRIYDEMFEAGKNHGKYAVEIQARENNMSKKEFMTDLVGAANIMGIGKIRINRFDLNEKVLIVEASNLLDHEVLDDSTTDSSKLISEFIRGMYHGMGEEMFETEVESNPEMFQTKKGEVVKITVTASE